MLLSCSCCSTSSSLLPATQPHPQAGAAAFLLAQRVVATGQLLWGGVLRGPALERLPPPARRTADALFWCTFAALVLAPLALSSPPAG